MMWWNFVGRNHDEIVTYRQLWQARDERFGAVTGYQGTLARLPARHCPLPGCFPGKYRTERMPDDHRQDRCGDHGHRRAGQVHDRGWG
ncbi:hypothetical protein BZL30_4069 [Mycobacterium kansasii]|uniref:Uncharacterized protein n=1 Tax=Mycobacterium kansasii TaxID=1768 RepID=A0A1V3X8Q7_MYCKA|nr:hypothetical protein BZL30_4069 [Mycobacterium kansasii]